MYKKDGESSFQTSKERNSEVLIELKTRQNKCEKIDPAGFLEPNVATNQHRVRNQSDIYSIDAETFPIPDGATNQHRVRNQGNIFTSATFQQRYCRTTQIPSFS